ncbi:Potassium voltage-gated channel subfamily H member 6 [Phytophthora citrophthora]|uniref:Potassium voltage-gated channel subfamily H member 6 n=1 Tax=Phytophthora citrophthora TaxID=4793 RepID=A0AAD9FYY6_9STRA|nr:Potassium voltage-gated channel subfamily H member 6 [Phytophthora citrophthora]
MAIQEMGEKRMSLVVDGTVDAAMVKHEWPGLSEFRDHAVSGVVLPHIPAHEVLEQRIVQDAERIGLSNLTVPRRTSIFPTFSRGLPRSIRVMPKTPENEGHSCRLKRRRQRPQSLVVVLERFKRWVLAMKKWWTPTNILAAASFFDSMYILLTAPLRVGFFFDPWQNAPYHDAWQPELIAFTTVDMTGSVLRLWNSRTHLSVGVRLLLKRRVSQSELAQQEDDTEEDEGDRTNSVRSIRSTTSTGKKRTVPDGWIAWTILVMYCIPWELLVIVVLRGQHVNILHVFGMLRLLTAHNRVGSQLAAAIGGIPQKLASGTVANVMVLFFYGVYFCHVAACGYMLVAHWECGLEFMNCTTIPRASGCWVLHDRLESGSHFRRYVRTLYWACKTVVTLGQGDLIPVTLAETGYRIVVQFFAGLWVTAILTAYTFFFTHKDANLTSNISTRLAQAMQFLEARKAPSQLVTSVDTYFQYMQRTRNGVEEELILAALPPHYRTQCSHYVRYKAIAPLTIFRRRKGAFLRTVMGALVRDVYAPGQTLLQPGDTDEMFIVACGEVRLIDPRGACAGRILAGNAYAEYALFERHLAKFRVEAATFCEVWYLPTKAFKAALAKHFSKLVYASLLLQQFGTKSLAHGDDRTSSIRNESESRVDSVTSMKTRARHSKVFGHGSLLLQAVEARKLRNAAAAIAAAAATPNGDRVLSNSLTQLIVSRIAPWRMLNSKFRQHWALAECLLLLYLLAEVPYHLAFQRGFGLLNGVAGSGSDGTTPRSVQVASFLVSLVVEIFFYSDLILRAFYFVRSFPGVEVKEEFLGNSTPVGGSLEAPNAALTTRKSQIFQLYLQHESLVMEFLALAPAALAWDILPKELFSRRSVHVFRCLRLLRLLRVRKLRGKLRGVLTGRGYGPALRLLADVVVLSSATAHAAACVFFAVADRTSFEGGLPVNGVAPGSLSLPTCLEDASRFDNCTWYMYDRSVFDMDAPYLRSMLWSIVLLSTVGFGDIVAFSTRECIVDALWIFFSANICYITSCALSSVLAQINVLATIRHDRIEGINVLLMSPSMASVSDATKRTIRSYYEAKWKLNGSAVGDLELLEHLPRSLRRAVSSQLYAPDLRRCALFVEECGLRAASTNGDAALFMQQLALMVTCEHFLRNVTVIKEGHLATEFFVVLSGELECLLPPVPLECNETPANKLFSATRMARHSIHLAATAAMKRTRDSARMARDFTASTLQGVRAKEGGAQPRPSIRPRFDPVREEGYSVRSRSSTSEPRSRSSIVSGRSSITPSHLMPRPVLSEMPSDRLPKLLHYGSLTMVMGAMRDPTVADAAPVPISVLKQHDYFGEESLSDIAKVYEVSIRVVSSARVAMIRRRDFLALAARFPQYVARLRKRKAELREKTRKLVFAHRANFQGESNKKIVRVLGTCTSLYMDSSKSKLEKRGARVLDPMMPFARWWHRGIGFILVYNFYVIIFRLAFLPYPDAATMSWFTGIDYALDVLLYADVILKFGHLGYTEFGEPVLDPESIKKHYRASGRLWQDCLGMLPLYYRGDPFGMTAARLPRLLRCLQLGELLQEVHTEIQERFLRGDAVLLSIFDLVKFFLIFVSTAHYIASMYYLLGWTQLKTNLVDTSWVSVDLILQQNPDNPMVHYMRSMYWCLSAFTVDCFGDILARNFLESCYELFTCVLGWVFIGQVIGRINALMITLNKTQKQRNDRVEDFQQYAKQRALPDRLRQRAMKGLTVKARCQLELDLHTTLRDLPGALRARVTMEMYSGLLQPLPEFTSLSLAQLEAIARALVLEIYLPGDIICESNRIGTRLCFLKRGCAERVAPRTGIVYGALTNGALFGEFAFFLPGAKRLFFVRAVRSCQVLQLQRRTWDRLWPPPVRRQIEQTVLSVVTRSYRRTAWGFLNIAKNFYVKNDTPVPTLGPKRRSTVSRRPIPVFKSVKPRQPSRPSLATRASASGAMSLLPAVIRDPVVSFRRRVSASDMSSVSERTDVLESYRSILESSQKSTRDSFATANGATSSMEQTTKPAQQAVAAAITFTLPNSIDTEERVMMMPLARLSASTELLWKNHEKRLRAIQLFHVGWGYVQQDLRSLRELQGLSRKGRMARRRASVCLTPSYCDNRVARPELAARARAPAKRRHSIQTDPFDLRSKFTLSPAEVRVLEQRMTTGPGADTKTRPAHPTMLAQTVTSRTRSMQMANWGSKWWRNSTINNRRVTPFTATTKTIDPRADPNLTYSIWEIPGSRTARFDQNARFRDVWASFMLAVTLYYLVVIPLQIGFLDGVLNETGNEKIVVSWFIIEYLIADVACVVDFELHRKHFVFQTSSGEVVTDPERIAQHYWRHGWYLVDVLSMLPMELVLFAFVVGLRQAGYAPPPATTSDWPLMFSPLGGLVNWHTFAFLRINRFLRIVHLRPLSDQLQRFLLYDRRLKRLTPGICYLVRLALDFLLGTHWLSCLFYGVSYLAYDDGEMSWLTTPDMLAFGDGVRDLSDIRKVPLLQSYLRAYHFSIGAITTVCYGDIIPMNAQETLVTMAVIFISVAIFSMLSGGFYKYFDMELGRRAEYEEKVAQVGHFLKFHRFPSDTWRQMQVYFALSWRESRGRRERELLRGLPPSVRQDLAQHVHASLLKNVALFTRCDPTFARAIIAALQHEFFVRNDVIIQRGDMERSLYIVESGTVLILAVRKRQVHAEAGGAEEEEASNDPVGADDNRSPMVSVNEWVRASVRASLRLRKKKTEKGQSNTPRQRQKSLVALMSPTGTITDINKQTEREEKIYKGPFDYFGERSLLFGTPRNATCMALCVTSLFVLTSARFEAILEEFPHERSNSVSAWVMTRTPAKVAPDE